MRQKLTKILSNLLYSKSPTNKGIINNPRINRTIYPNGEIIEYDPSGLRKPLKKRFKLT